MAVTKIHPIKTTLNKAIDYICNPDKTDNQILISSYGCSYQTADIEFGFTLSKARDKGDNLGHHLIQSFAPGEVSYEEAHRIGKELADKVLGGRYEYVLTTHIDKGHIHNHIIFCAVDFATHRKYVSNKKSYYQIRNESDRLCKEHGFLLFCQLRNAPFYPAYLCVVVKALLGVIQRSPASLSRAAVAVHLPLTDWWGFAI